MKIISKVKDYYDYLSGIWGVDDKIVLTRTNEFRMNQPIDLSIHTFIIGGNLIQIYFDGNSYYFGEELKEFDDSTKYNRLDGYYRIPIGYKTGRQRNVCVAKNIQSGFDYLNEKFNSPIIYRCDSWYYHDVTTENFNIYPILSSTPIPRFIDPSDAYKMISDYLSRQLDNKLENIPTLSDTQKLQNKGFDKLSSFRPKYSPNSK